MSNINGRSIHEWMKYLATKVPAGCRKRVRRNGDKGPKSILHLSEFIEMIAKYEKPLRLKIIETPAINAPNSTILYVVGHNSKSTALTKMRQKVFPIDLTAAWEDGIQPEAHKKFRRLFSLLDAKDFYSCPSEVF